MFCVLPGQLEKVGRGVYVSADSIEDEMYSIQTKYSKLICSHETALNLHGFSDRTPFEYSASVPSGYKVAGTAADRFKIYYVKKELHEQGAETVKAPMAILSEPISLKERSVICSEAEFAIDVQILNGALK